MAQAAVETPSTQSQTKSSSSNSDALNHSSNSMGQTNSKTSKAGSALKGAVEKLIPGSAKNGGTSSKTEESKESEELFAQMDRELGIAGDSSSSSSTTTKKDYVDILASGEVTIGHIIHGEQEKGAKQYQEDSQCMYVSPDLTFLMASVFDGHGGLNGQVASLECAKLTRLYFERNWQRSRDWSQEEWQENMIRLFHYLHEKVRKSFIEVETRRREHNRQSTKEVVCSKGVVRKISGLPVHGGTTGSVVCAIRTRTNKWRVMCANVGDSDCLLLARNPNRLEKNEKYMHLSVDHSPDSATEYLRIRDLPTSTHPTKLLFVYDQANVCRKYDCPIVFLRDGTKDPKYVKNPWGNNLRPTNVRYDPAVYAVSPYGVSHDITCIAMTRSLGDFYAHQFGLSNVPDVNIYEFDGDNEYIITVGSDGIWDCWKWDDFSDYVNGVMTKQDDKLDSVTSIVLKHTVARAKACFGEGSFDDATLLLIALRKSIFPDLETCYPTEKPVEMSPSMGDKVTATVDHRTKKGATGGAAGVESTEKKDENGAEPDGEAEEKPLKLSGIGGIREMERLTTDMEDVATPTEVDKAKRVPLDGLIEDTPQEIIQEDDGPIKSLDPDDDGDIAMISRQGTDLDA